MMMEHKHLQKLQEEEISQQTFLSQIMYLVSV